MERSFEEIVKDVMGKMDKEDAVREGDKLFVERVAEDFNISINYDNEQKNKIDRDKGSFDLEKV